MKQNIKLIVRFVSQKVYDYGEKNILKLILYIQKQLILEVNFSFFLLIYRYNYLLFLNNERLK